jgi:chemotaxis protein methyltransferase CheR
MGQDTFVYQMRTTMLPMSIQMPERSKLEEKDFLRISQYIQHHFGIKLPVSKLVLVESRLSKRLSALNLKSFSDYVKFVFSAEGHTEKTALIDFITTNKTDFFREDVHFKYLENYIRVNKISKPLQIWSAACSSGEEPYTISMVFEEMKASQQFSSPYSILATDISLSILSKAIAGEYSETSVKPISKALVAKYFFARESKLVVNAALRKPITFKRFNLVEDVQYYALSARFDFIFCRNVLIYFDHATQIKVIGNLVSRLAPGGHLFLGHCETLLRSEFPLTQIQPTIYQKTNE